MKVPNQTYRKNSSLIIAFLVLLSVVLVVALVVAYNLTKNNVESEFSTKKSEVLEQSINSYNDFLSNKVPQITSYQSLLDSALAGNYADEVFHDYPFVKQIVFYKVIVGNRPGYNVQNRVPVTTDGIYEYQLIGKKVVGVKSKNLSYYDEFVVMAEKFSRYIANYDTIRGPQPEDVFRIYYDIKPKKISYLNEPRKEDLKLYHDLPKSKSPVFYKQNMLTFWLDVHSLVIKNPYPELYQHISIPELYQHISIEQLTYDPLDIDRNNVITDQLALPGAFSDYKLYFSSPRDYLFNEINRRFMPVGGVVLLIYVFIVIIGWLIYRNVETNLKLFKLQYDFINNFTHEFKTPVSVIKIAGSNLRGDSELTDRQRKHYGKILDEEADKLNELMNKLLSFTQLENKSITIKKDKINVSAFIHGYIDTFKVKYPDFKLSCHIKGVKEFYADPVLLGSIFQNLFENAYKYSHHDNKQLVVNVSLDKRNIIFSFIDKGIGIPKAELNNIFKKFYRLENQYNQNGSVGLGLAFCKELVNFMNGELIVQSKINQGSEFKVILPYENKI
jgi:two-component system, OmpR family, phosphate regulon sensor histidine kinase PhoR